MKVGVGHSEDVDSADVIQEVLDACAEQLGGVTPQAGILFSALDHDHQALVDGVMDRYPDLELIGATTDGEVSSAIGFAENSVTLMLFQSDKVSFAAGVGRDISDNPERAGRQAAEMAMAGLDGAPRLCVATPEGLFADIESALKGMAGVIGPDVPICGGLAGDQLSLSGTFQFHKREVLSQAAPVLLFSDPLVVSTAIGCGWQPIGAKHRVTDVDGAVVKEIDGKPAIEIYEEYIGSFSISHPLIVYPNDSDQSFLSAGMEAKEGGILFHIAVPIGSYVQLSSASRGEALDGAAAAAATVVERYPGSKPDAGFIFSCAGRRLLLGTRVADEYELLKEKLGADVPVCGFYTYGELCPLPGGTAPQAHDSTFVTVLIGED
ncbi:MAG TPA: FIST N-terminal domain-containing protein [Rhodothermales bacterium]|nr:FIST N-terminal domain-containing protein [Rhodothermales bacterium]